MTHKSKKRLRLFHENSKCCYCGIQTRLVEIEIGKPSPHDLATLEHLNDRYDENRYGEQKYAIACYKCNHARGKERCKQFNDRISDTSIKHTNLLRVALLHKNKERAMEIIAQIKSHIEQNL